MTESDGRRTNNFGKLAERFKEIGAFQGPSREPDEEERLRRGEIDMLEAFHIRSTPGEAERLARVTGNDRYLLLSADAEEPDEEG